MWTIYLGLFLFPNLLVTKLLIFNSFYLNFTFTSCVFLYSLFVYFLRTHETRVFVFLLCYYEFTIINAWKL